MSAEPPDEPENPHPPETEPRPEPARRFDAAKFFSGTFLGAFALFLVYLFVFASAGPSGLPGPSAFIPLAVYLLGAIPLAVRRGTSSFGAGLLVGLALWVLVGGGVCVANLARLGGFG